MSFIVILFSLINIWHCLAMQVPIPTLKKLASHAVVIHNKKDESQCPIDLMPEIALMETFKSDPSKAMENAINADDNDQIDFLLGKKVYITNSNFRVHDHVFEKVIAQDDIQKIKKWLQAGVNLDARRYWDNITSDRMAIFLISNQYCVFDPYELSGEEDTLLMRRCKENRLDLVQQLLDDGAYVNARNFLGLTALRYAPTIEIMKCLIENGADLNVIDETGSTVLEKVIKKNQYSKVELLINAGANLINRHLQALRQTKTADHRAGKLFVRSWPKLASLGEFDPGYLHQIVRKVDARQSAR